MEEDALPVLYHTKLAR